MDCGGIFDLFVYGTLKRGGLAHRRLCSGARFLGNANVVGELRIHPRGYPVLVVPAAPSFGFGVASAPAYTERYRARVPAETRSDFGNWRRVYGEILRFYRPRRDVPPIVAYEAAECGMRPTYRRIFIPVFSPFVRSAWTFAAALPEAAIALEPHPRGSWP